MSDSERGRGLSYEPDEDEDDYYTYDATDEEDEGGRRPLVLLAIIALIVVFAGVVFFAYKQGMKQGAQGNPPVIRADDSPIKVAPANPGGIEIPHQDKTVYDRFSGAEKADEQGSAEHLLPSPEEPMAMKQPTPPAASGASPAPAAPSSPAASTAPAGAAPAPAVTPAPTGTVAQQAVPPAASAQPQATAGTAPTATAAPVAVTPPATAGAPAQEAAAGGYVVQLAAFRDEPSARAEFKKLQKKYPALAGLSADIQRADLGAKGIYYRLRGGYMDKPKAAELCASLKAQGQACFVKSR
ncbi:SPOR domain-containing protein [Parvibaculum sp.]|uniref:SPOR domain-containing protein n=1 Tax=Parvibaculum sp. TaxID=2024848 RepID=UPI003211442B